ncbi:hypothetical protein FBR04_02010 [Betaproteobacteria bacterium PRO7]|nr:hypothetical protein [Betaproteobacteria bacterium PRO7]
MSQFAFLQREWPAVFEAASKAEGALHADPRTAAAHPVDWQPHPGRELTISRRPNLRSAARPRRS